MLKKLAGNGKWEVKLVTLPDAFDLVLVLPGPTARSIRTKVGNYMVRVLGGDLSLIREIEDNAASDAPLPKMARASMKSGPRPAALGSDQPPIKKLCIEIDTPDLITRGQGVCKLYEMYKMTSGGDIAVEIRQEYNLAILNIFRCLNPISGAVEKSRAKKGHVYCFQSTAQPELVKIGLTTGAVKQRLHQVNYQSKVEKTNGPFVYRYSVRSLDIERDEKLAHAHFAAVRLPGRGELFRTTPESVLDFFERVIKPGHGMESGEAADMEVEEMDCADMDVEPSVDEEPTDVPADEGPTDMPADEAPVDVPSDEAPTDVPADEATTYVPANEAPTDVRMGGVPAAVPVAMPRNTPQVAMLESLKAFILEHMMCDEGSFTSSAEIREVFLRYTGADAALFPAGGGYNPAYKQMTAWLNGGVAPLIVGVFNKQKHVPFLRRTASVYINLAWRDGAVTGAVQEARIALTPKAGK